MKNKLTAILLAAVLIFSLSACGKLPAEDKDKFSIVCSIFVVYDFARQTVGDKAEVTMLLPPGAESHSYEPTPADIIRIENADIFFYVSEHTETWVPQLLKAVKDNRFDVCEIADELGIKIHDHDGHDEDGHDEGAEADEHIWTNMEWAEKMLRLTAEKICAADPENSAFYTQNAEKYLAEIQTLRADFERLTSSAERKEIVSGSRFAMKNFTEEFGLSFTAAFDSCADNTEPGAAVMAKIIDKITKDNIPVIFYEELTEPKIARAVSKETGAKMLLLHSCHNVSADELRGGASYVSLMRQNYQNLKEALN